MHIWLLILAAAFLLTAEPGIAKPYILKCMTDKGQPIADLSVDLDEKVMLWAGTRYRITTETDRYITGISANDSSVPPVGGEVWVLDRVSGQYKRAMVGMYYRHGTPPSGPFWEADTNSGRCSRPIL